MKTLRKRKRLQRLLHSNAALVVLCIVALFLVRGLSQVFHKYQTALGNEEETASTLHAMKRREADLSAKVDRLATERGIEEEIRERFNVAKPNEGVIYVVEKDSHRAEERVDPTSGNTYRERKGFWETIRSIFSRED